MIQAKQKFFWFIWSQTVNLEQITKACQQTWIPSHGPLIEACKNFWDLKKTIQLIFTLLLL